MDDPPFDLAQLARGQGATGYGPIHDIAALQSALASAIRDVQAGAVCVIDVRVAPEYARAVSSALMRNIPTDSDKSAASRASPPTGGSR
jgi:hypothetical protein